MNIFQKIWSYFTGSKEETRTLEFKEEWWEKPCSGRDANAMMVALLQDAITHGKIKRYQKVMKFIQLNEPGLELPMSIRSIDQVGPIEPTDEIKALAHQWKTLKFKCSDENLDKYMKFV